VSTDCSPTAGTSRPASSRLRCSRTAARSRAASSRTTAPSSSSGSAVEPPRTRRSAASDRPQGRGRARAGEHAALTAPRGRARRRPRRVRRARPRRRDARARPLGRPARGQPRRRPRDGARVDARAAPRGGARAGDPRRGASLLRRRGAPDGPPRRRQVARVRGGRRRRAARPRARRPCARHLVPRLDAARDRRPRAVAPPRLHLSVRPPRPVAAPPTVLALAALRRTLPLRIGGLLQAARASVATLHHWVVSRAVVDRCHALQTPVVAWTVDDRETIRRLAALGVDAVVTNDPRLFDAVYTQN